jgi:hypothetical protein
VAFFIGCKKYFNSLSFKKDKLMPNKPNVLPFKIRGENMNRIETFVVMAFAFAVIMLVISVGTFPETMQDFVDATRQIPAFSANCAVLCGFGIPTRCGVVFMV